MTPDLIVRPIARAMRKATRADLHDVAAVIGEAFVDLPPCEWLVPDDLWDRQGMVSNHAQLWAAHALRHGHIDVMDHAGIEQRAPVAVAVWFHDHENPAPLQPLYDRNLADACMEHTWRFHELDLAMETHHPDNQPHQHLAFIATHPVAHGHGLGSRLLRAHHTRLDKLGLPSFTEARNRRNRDWLTHFGYRAAQPYRLPRGPRVWPMWREPITTG